MVADTATLLRQNSAPSAIERDLGENSAPSVLMSHSTISRQRQEVLSSKHHMPNEVDSPSPWLRAWVEFHVDARINQALRHFISGDSVVAGSPTPEYNQQEKQEAAAKVLAKTQAKLLEIVNGMSVELAQVKQVQGELTRSVRRAESQLSAWRGEVAMEIRALTMCGKRASTDQRVDATTVASLRSDVEACFVQVQDKLDSLAFQWSQELLEFEKRLTKEIPAEAQAFPERDRDMISMGMIDSDCLIAKSGMGVIDSAIDEQRWQEDGLTNSMGLLAGSKIQHVLSAGTKSYAVAATE